MNPGIPFIPTSLWIIAAAISAAVMVTFLLIYQFNRRRIAAISDLGGSVADLSAKKDLLQADLTAIRDHITAQKDELHRVDGERAEQEKLRLELDELTRKVQAMESQNQALRDEVGQLELAKHNHSEKIQQMIAETQAAEHQRDTAIEKIKGFKEEIQDLDRSLRQMEEAEMSKRTELNKLENDLKETQALKRELSEKITDSETRLHSLDSEIGHKESRLSDYHSQIEIKKTQLTELEQKIEKLKVNKEELSKAQEKLLEMQDKIASMEKQEQNLGTEFATRNAMLSKLQEHIEAMQHRKNDLGQEIEKLNDSREELRQTREKLSEISDKISSLEKKEHALRSDCAQQESIRDELSKSLNQKKAELAEMEKKVLNFGQKRQEMLQMEARRAAIERDVNRLEIEQNLLMEKVNKLKKDMDQNGAVNNENISKSYGDLLVAPACLGPEEFPANPIHMDELQALQKFKDNLAKEELVFHDRVINAFHTALKCADINPLTVLAGVSGTGKTLLPIKYARYMGMHSLVMAVQPRWDSPQDMFGFYNYLEKRYKATEMAQALVRMDPYHSFMKIGGLNKDRMLMVLMDEMNLARTEYYFSEFLSKLELRRDVKAPSDSSDRKRAEIVLDLGPNIEENARLWVGGNVLFVGTMNEDETTQTLSDKVLDRSNILRFGKPTSRLPNQTKHHDPEKAKGFLTYTAWNKWIRQYNGQSWSKDVANWTERINSALQRVGRPFGYRVENAIRAYVANYPEIGTGESYKMAFADQIEQKVLPKLRGLDGSDSHTKDCLTQIQDLIDELGDKELGDSLKEAIAKAELGLFHWPGVSRTQEKS